jgi:hypothetical protein
MIQKVFVKKFNYNFSILMNKFLKKGKNYINMLKTLWKKFEK